MTRIPVCLGFVGAVALGIAAPAFADSQLAASAGLTTEQAAGMTLTEIAQVKFNREASDADRSLSSIPPTSGSADSTRLAASAGIAPDAAGMSLTEIAAVKFNNDTRPDDRQSVVHASGVTVATRSVADPQQHPPPHPAHTEPPPAPPTRRPPVRTGPHTPPLRVSAEPYHILRGSARHPNAGSSGPS